MSALNTLKLQRLMRMGPAELSFRVWQEACKTVERLATAGGEGHPPSVLRHLARGGSRDRILDLYRAGRREQAGALLVDDFQQSLPSRFFAGCSDPSVAAGVGRDHPVLREAVIDSADAVRRGEFPILGYGRLRFGEPLDWHLDPVSGKRSPLLHWSRINPLDKDEVGDSKVVWELNRHQWMLELGQAYVFTGDEDYAQVFAARLRDWMRNNPVGLGINWSSALEAAMRLIAWSWAMGLFRGAATVPDSLRLDMLSWMRAHAVFVERYLSYYFSPNTHLTGEALGLYYAGTLLREVREAGRWRALGRRILLEQLERQVHADGVYFEQSTRYQYYTLEIYLHFLILARRNGEEIPDSAQRKVQRMLDFVLALRRPDGSLPQTGDHDGGWLLPLARRAPEDFRALFALGAALFKRADYGWAAGGETAEVGWLLGREGINELKRCEPAAPRDASPRHFPEGGWLVMRSGWDAEAHHLIFDVGPLGCTVSSGHGHADLLAIQCSAFGEPYLVDAGTGCYTANLVWRDYFRSTAAHNTVMVDGRDQARMKGPFGWEGERPAARLTRLECRPELELADAHHEAYGDLADPVSHRRRVVFLKPGCWLLVDDLQGGGEHQVDLRFQFAPLRVEDCGEGWLRARGKKGQALLLKSFCARSLQSDLRTGALDPAQGWVSPDYGQRRPAPALSCKAGGKLPLRIVTLLYPSRNPDAPPPVAEALEEDGRIAALRLGDALIRIEEEDIRLDGDGRSMTMHSAMEG